MYIKDSKYSYAREISWCWNVVPLTLWLTEHLVLCGRWLWQYPRWGRADSDPHMSRWTHRTGPVWVWLAWRLQCCPGGSSSHLSHLSSPLASHSLPYLSTETQVRLLPPPSLPPSLSLSPSSKHQFTSWNISVFSLRWVWWDRSDADICQDNLYFDHHDLWDVSSSSILLRRVGFHARNGSIS